MRYEILSESEILDTQTNLVWQMATAESLTFSEALDYATQLSKETGQAWRVPTIDELVGLIDWTRASPASAFPDMTHLAFWSSSPYVGFTYSGWYVNFSSGNVGNNYRGSSLNAVRLVRDMCNG